MKVLALDPGERVGWAAGTVTGGGDIASTLEVDGHGIAFLKDCALAVYRGVVVERRYDAVVYETFRLTPKGAKVSIGSDLQTVQFIGMVRVCCWVAGVKLYPQGPGAMNSARKSLRIDHPSAPDVRERVAKADAVAHDDGHDGSALLHLWTWFFERHV